MIVMILALLSLAIPWLFSPAPQKSLLQLLNSLTKDIDTAFENIKVYTNILKSKTIRQGWDSNPRVQSTMD